MGEQSGVVSVSTRTACPADIPSVHRWPVVFTPGALSYACLEVKDTGWGIAEDVIEKLFDPFYSTRFIGRGLGLPVALGSVKTHGGCITLETEPGQGSIFRVHLPLTTEAVPRPKAIPQVAAVGPRENLTVLLVEDDPLARETGAMVLRRLDMNVLEAKDGIEAVEVFRKHQKEIHCVLCDLTMPRMNGWQTIEALRRLAPESPLFWPADTTSSMP
ncbi:MAG: response regulator [Candidatus Desulfacyla sp.]